MIHQISNSIGNYNYNIFIYGKISYQMHFHKNFEIIYVTDGEMQLTYSGIQTNMLRSECLIIPPNIPHEFDIPQGSQVWVGVFSEDFFPRFAKEYGGTIFSIFKCDSDTENFLIKTLFSRTDADIYTIIGCLYLLAAQCTAHAETAAARIGGDLANDILRYVYENFSEDLTLRQTAAALGYEYHYFSGVFHKFFMMNFKAFLNMCRFEAACEIISDPTKSLTEIALESGFGSVRNFNRIFKKLSGKSPSEYRLTNVTKL